MDAVNEIRLLASVRHPNIVAYNEAFVDGNRLCIVMEYAPHGDMARSIKRRAQVMAAPCERRFGGLGPRRALAACPACALKTARCTPLPLRAPTCLLFAGRRRLGSLSAATWPNGIVAMNPTLSL